MASNEDVESRGGRHDKYGRNEGYYVAESETEREWTSRLVPLFVVANVAMFIVTMFINNCPKKSQFGDSCVATFLGRFSFEPLRQNPLFGPSSLTLLKLGSLEWNRVVHQHQEWRLVSCIWLHAGVIHLLANMLSLLFIGVRLEQQFSFRFLTGLLLGFVLLMRPQLGWMEHLRIQHSGNVRSKYTVYQYILLVVSLLLLIVGFAVGLVMLFRGKNLNGSCHWCRYLSCIPTSRWTCGN